MNTFRIREVRDDDHAWLISLHNDPDVLRNLTHPNPITFDQHIAWWKSIKCNKSQCRFIFTVNDVNVGFVKIYDIDLHNQSCILGADIAKEHRGKGYAKRMWTLMLQYCFDILRLHRVSLTTAEYNLIAQGVYVGLGFREEGRLTRSLLRDGKFYDQILMYMLEEHFHGTSEDICGNTV
jgi:UDP-4-amino-4,6-dideoxy-N-acetyl-beta-L-altrosamine N-acetyltransferase